jgi:hypothetical protein
MSSNANQFQVVCVRGCCSDVPIVALTLQQKVAVRQVLTLGRWSVVFFAWLLLATGATILWDFTRVPSKTIEYNQVNVGMSDTEVLALLGPSSTSSVERIEARLLDNHLDTDRRQITITRRCWDLNHYTIAYIDFDANGTAVYKSPPSSFGPRYPTLTRIRDWYYRHVDKINDSIQELLGPL